MRVIRFNPRTLVKVLVFTLVSAVFTAALLVKIGNLRLFSHTYTLSAEFADASGVFKGDAVKIAGVDVGRVEGARIEDGHAVVTFNVNDSVKLTRDSVVAIRWRNVLGQRFLYVYPGRAAGPALATGATIPATQTEDAGDIGAFLNSLGPILRAIDPDKANAFLDAVNGALAGNEASVRLLVDDGAVLARQLADMDDQIKTLISSSDTVMSTYAKQNKSIGSIIDGLDLLGGRLRTMTSDVNALLTNFADVQTELDSLLRNNRGNIDAALGSLQVVAQTLQRNRANLATTLCTLPIGLAGYFQTTSWGEWFNVRLTQVIVKDNHSNPVFTESELGPQRSDTADPAVVGCDGKTGNPPPGALPGVGVGPGASQGAPAAKAAAKPSAGTPAPTGDGFESVDGFLRFVTDGAGA